MALKWIRILYLLVLYYLVKSRLVMLLPFAVEKTPVSRAIADEVVYNSRYVFIFLIYFPVHLLTLDKLLYRVF